MKNSFITEPYRYDYTNTGSPGRTIVTFASPIFDDKNEVIGLTGLDLEIDKYIFDFALSHTNTFTNVCILSKDGTFYFNQCCAANTDSAVNTPFVSIDPKKVDKLINKFVENDTLLFSDITYQYTDPITKIKLDNIIRFYPLRIEQINSYSVLAGMYVNENASYFHQSFRN